MSEAKNRRSTHVDLSTSYASVGASQAEDLLKFPPAGCTPFQHEVLLGSAEDRFVAASTTLMTWGAQRGAGVTVETVSTAGAPVYTGMIFSETGVPSMPDHDEQQFAPDGTPYLSAGSVVSFSTERSPEPSEMRVVSTIDEPRRVGFIIGTTATTGIIGEQLFTVEFRKDDTVWGVARGFFTVEQTGVLGIKGKTMLRAAISQAREQLQSLTPAGLGAANGTTQDENPSGE